MSSLFTKSANSNLFATWFVSVTASDSEVIVEKGYKSYMNAVEYAIIKLFAIVNQGNLSIPHTFKVRQIFVCIDDAPCTIYVQKHTSPTSNDDF